MGRYPFTDCLNEYLPAEDGHLSDETLATTKRRLRQIGKIFHQLKGDGKVSSDNPRKISEKDIDIFVGYRKKSGVKNTTIQKDLSYLSKLFVYFDNDSVNRFKVRYPSHVPKTNHIRLPPMEDEIVEMIIERASIIDVEDWKLMEAYGLVTVAICTGLRAKELRLLSVHNVIIDENGAKIFAERVKGEGSYGQARWVPVHIDGVEILSRYLVARRIKLNSCGKDEDALFPPIFNDGGFLSYKSIRIFKTHVETDIGERFDLRKCRRTFGQRAVNEGQDFHNVSLAMGHTSLATTQRNYCDKEQKSAVEEMRSFWSEKTKGKEGV